jgi:hypothetical protein
VILLDADGFVASLVIEPAGGVVVPRRIAGGHVEGHVQAADNLIEDFLLELLVCGCRLAYSGAPYGVFKSGKRRVRASRGGNRGDRSDSASRVLRTAEHTAPSGGGVPAVTAWRDDSLVVLSREEIDCHAGIAATTNYGGAGTLAELEVRPLGRNGDVTEDEDRTDFEDELAKVNIDQLHRTVLQIGGNCFEIKKLCATTLVAAVTLVAAFTNKQLDAALWVGAGLATLVFWVLDAQSYYYQEKLRARMKTLAEARARVHAPHLDIDGVGMPLDEHRKRWNPRERAVHAFWNPSMAFYWILLVLVVLIAVLHGFGVIHSSPTPSSEG